MRDSVIDIHELRRGVLLAGRRVSAARDDLCLLDAVAGDGDLGVTLAAGFAHVEHALDQPGIGDAGILFKTVGLQLSRNAPSTIGALLGGAFVRISREFDGVRELGGEDVVRFLQIAADRVAEQGGAQPGERTVLDAMSQAAAEARRAVAEELGPRDVLRRGADGATRGAAATAGMEPVHGRAGWIAERARGEQDAGATAWALYLSGLADGVGGDHVATAGALQNDNKDTNS